MQHQQVDDDESDSDYVPRPEGEHNSDSSSNSEGEEKGKRPRLGHDKLNSKESAEDPEERKVRLLRERETLWKSFKEDVRTSQRPKEQKRKTVKVVKVLRFAGENITQVVEVPEDSEEAKKWPLWKDETPDDTPKDEPLISPDDQKERKIQLSESSISTASSINDPQSSIPPSSSLYTTNTVSPSPTPRKRKTLSSIPSTKPKKISTLDKSLMDWSSHISSSSNQHIREELEANRRGGGFIEKVEFMERVSERKEEGRAMATGSKRRR